LAERVEPFVASTGLPPRTGSSRRRPAGAKGMNATSDRSGYLPGIALLRCQSMLFVLLCHIASGAYRPPPGLVEFESLLKPLGWVGVSIFFCMSGYLMEHLYGERVRRGAMSFRDYAAKRCRRIYPTYLAVAVPAIVAFIWIKHDNLQVALGGSEAYAMLLQSWVADRAIYLGGNVPAWSLSVEAFLYVVSFGLLRLNSRLLAAVVPLVAGAVIYQAWPLLTLDVAFQQRFEWGFYIFPPLRLIEFCAGIILCRLQRDRPAPALHDRAHLLLGAAAIVLAACVANAKVFPLVLRWQLLIAVPACMAVHALSRVDGSRLGRQAAASLHAFADRSYSVFLTHYLCISLVHRLLEHFHRSAQPLGVAAEWCRMGLLLVGCLAIGDLAYRYIERPLSARWAGYRPWKSMSA
jgi:peptidoglycan/LPS O-acetylase OafA/YrhL